MRRATPRSAARRARAPRARAKTCAPGAGGGRRTRRKSAASTARSRRVGSSTSCARSSERNMTTELKGEAREVALAEAQSVLAMARDDEMRARVGELVAAAEEGAVDGDAAELLESVLERGLQAGRIRAYYGPGGEQAALSTLRKLPRGRVRTDSTREVSAALQALAGKPLDSVKLAAVAPGAFTLSFEADGYDLSVRLDAHGARLTSVGT